MVGRASAWDDIADPGRGDTTAALGLDSGGIKRKVHRLHF